MAYNWWNFLLLFPEENAASLVAENVFADCLKILSWAKLKHLYQLTNQLDGQDGIYLCISDKLLSNFD